MTRAIAMAISATAANGNDEANKTDEDGDKQSVERN